MSRFRLSEQAKTDLNEIWDYIGIANDNPAAAYRQLETLYEKFTILATQPFMGHAREDLRTNLRSFAAGSYIIFYVPIQEGIEVERIIHGSRDINALF